MRAPDLPALLAILEALDALSSPGARAHAAVLRARYGAVL